MDELTNFKNLDYLEMCNSAHLITDGWSKDIKFKLNTNSNQLRLLRLSSIDLFERKSDHYKSLQPLKELPLSISKPVEFGTCFYKEQEYCYTLFSWVDGVHAEKIIDTFSKEDQLSLGYESGQILKKIHSIPIQEKYVNFDWSGLFNKKLNRNIKTAQECPIKYDRQENIISYIEANRGLLESRPICFHHGDYHIGNMLIDNRSIGVIDFNRQDHGDPWEEFNRITWCSSVSPEFATGKINGYFQGQVPDDFFKLLALYIASNQLSSIPWAISFGQNQVDIMLSEVQKVLSSYSNFENVVPSWYLGGYPHK